MAATGKRRWILHADMDAFYASVEQRDFPELAGLPLVVGGQSKRGVVAAASYEARQFGVRSAMPMREALARCPQLVCQKSRMGVYQSVSEQVFEIFRSFTPDIEGLSLDEAFLDIGPCLALFGSPISIAQALKKKVRDETGLTVSTGVAPNKLVAKIASDLDKPDGLVIVQPDQIQTTLDPLPAQVIPGIGKKTLERLHRVGIRTVADLRLAPRSSLESAFGKLAEHMRNRASGEDDREVQTLREDKSISSEETFATDLDDVLQLDKELLILSDKTASRVRKKNLLAVTVQLKIRQADFQTFTRQEALHPASNHTDTIYQRSRELLSRWRRDNPGRKIRLLGVGCSGFVTNSQIDLFDTAIEEDLSAVDRTVDSIRRRFGSDAVGRARTIDNDDA